MLIRHASALAQRLGVSSLLIGLTLVAFGTSAPELAASLVANQQGFPTLAMGNVLGSNTANIALVLALAALIAPVMAEKALLRRDVPIMLLTSLLLLPLTWDYNGDGWGEIGRLEGAAMLLLLFGYVALLWRSDRETLLEDSHEAPLEEQAQPGLGRMAFYALLGIGLLVLGANWLVQGASSLARTLGISERVIGVTMVAIGTSLPELAAAIAAARKRLGGIVVGNVIGSNIFNVLSILGVTSLVKPLAVVPEVANVDFWVMLAVGTLAGLLLLWRGRLARLEGAMLLTVYAVYMAYIAVLQWQQLA